MKPESPRQKATREEILAAAENLFRQHPVDAVAIEQITREADIAKGTFYLYFASKSALLAALAERQVALMATRAREVAAVPGIAPPETFVRILASLKAIEFENEHLRDELDGPDNVELHEQVNIALVRKLGPVMAEVIERGLAGGDFDVADPLSTVQFILAGQAFLLGNARFGWSEAENSRHLVATLTLTERALGAPPGSLTQRILAALSRPDAPTSGDVT